VNILTATCHCGAVRIEVDDTPTYLNECHCSICRRYGVRWAYYAPSAVRIISAADAIEMYSHGERNLGFYRCASCGCVTHWSELGQPGDRMGLNGNLFPPSAISAVPVRMSAGPP
jgi:hypothetical protein